MAWGRPFKVVSIASTRRTPSREASNTRPRMRVGAPGTAAGTVTVMDSETSSPAVRARKEKACHPLVSDAA